jgi:hypothetical protein
MRTVRAYRILRSLGGGLTLTLGLLLVGCGGGQKGTVSGKVTYKNEPLKGGTVTFVSADTTAVARAPIQSDGTYKAENVPVGEVSIGVETESVKPLSLPPQAKGGGIPKGLELPADAKDKITKLGPSASADRYMKIPKEYATPQKSGLTLKVTGGLQSHDIPLK